jgi:hypothetical protein
VTATESVTTLFIVDTFVTETLPPIPHLVRLLSITVQGPSFVHSRADLFLDHAPFFRD